MVVRGPRWPVLLSVLVDTLILGGFLLVSIGHSVGASSPGEAPRTDIVGSVNTSTVDLTVNPPSFWMRSGATVSLGAEWSGGPPFCTVDPLWYRWSVSGETAAGFLNGTTGPSTTFTAESFVSGVALVSVQSEAIVACGPIESVIERANETQVSVVAPLSLSGVELSPNPALPGQNASLEAVVGGGEPPYTIGVAWGDGNSTSLELPSPGSFSVNHTFWAGDFVPAVTVVDAYGDRANGSVDEPLSVGTGLEVAILPSAPIAEAGLPAGFTGIVEGAASGTVTFFECANATAVPEESPGPNESAISCTFHSAGTSEVFFGAFPSRPGGPSATVVLYEPVVSPPSVIAIPTEGEAEAGRPALVRVAILGGVPPIALSWALPGTSSMGVEELPDGDGEGVVSVALENAGDFTVQFRVSDSLGINGTNATGTLIVEPRLTASATAGTEFSPSVEEVQVRASVFPGCVPLEWWTVPDYASSNESVPLGNLSSAGSFVWNASYTLEGNLSVTVVAADGCGGTWQSALELSLRSPLDLFVVATPGATPSNGTVTLSVSIQGGTPPFEVSVNAGGNQSWNRTVPLDGSFEWRLTPVGNGTVGLAVSVQDSWGFSEEVDLSIFLVPPAGLPPPNPAPSPPLTPPAGGQNPPNDDGAASPLGRAVALAAVLGVLATLSTVLYIRRRQVLRRTDAAPSPDPVTTLRNIIEPADGAERFTVELLAEEAGIPLVLVRSTIDRLVTEGRLHSELGADGEEVLSWSSGSGQ